MTIQETNLKPRDVDRVRIREAFDDLAYDTPRRLFSILQEELSIRLKDVEMQLIRLKHFPRNVADVARAEGTREELLRLQSIVLAVITGCDRLGGDEALGSMLIEWSLDVTQKTDYQVDKDRTAHDETMDGLEGSRKDRRYERIRELEKEQ